MTVAYESEVGSVNLTITSDKPMILEMIRVNRSRL